MFVFNSSSRIHVYKLDWGSIRSSPRNDNGPISNKQVYEILVLIWNLELEHLLDHVGLSCRTTLDWGFGDWGLGAWQFSVSVRKAFGSPIFVLYNFNNKTCQKEKSWPWIQCQLLALKYLIMLDICEYRTHISNACLFSGSL